MLRIHRLSEITVLDLVGNDSPTILNNLTTNHVRQLEVGCGCESFITDVRGKTLALVDVFRTNEGFRLIGAAGQAEAISQHADRYTIREDSRPVDRSSDFTAFVFSPDVTGSLQSETDWDQTNSQRYEVNWLGEGTFVILTETPGAVEQVIQTVGESIGDDDSFHFSRTVAGYPWYGSDISEKNLPQEASRIEKTICFTKGCYLGQETVARLDALGQVQKQLMRWRISGHIPAAGAEVSSEDKVVGRLTSIAKQSDETAIAIGMTRRSHFEVGSTATGEGFAAVVIDWSE
ncbi:aminomethyltransferase [Stieleria sp. JC731]|uniref:CAF17-like 4Fe-4S cluster assembly/insertion protein YgfZ n=1 Tax=Pirellulaceae TaxID=2691357 RepID=UPI001E35102F|nr:aminomethyltransferase [Stieleria sp. JC731]MCC9603471.1 aminomethyltransferase [Stieleria sp. JC731]